MSTSTSLIRGESYDILYSTDIYTPLNGWEFIATMVSVSGLSIEAVPNFENTGFDSATSTYKFVFTSDTTSTLEHGNVNLFIKVQRDFTPPKSVKDVKYLVSNHNINCIDPTETNNSTAHYQLMLNNIKLTLQARAGDGVAEYNIADYGMKYIPIEKLIEMEKYYQSKLDAIYGTDGSSTIAQVSLL